MTARTRLWVLAISTPIIVFVLVGGYLGQAMAKDDTYQHLGSSMMSSHTSSTTMSRKSI
jgi:hypothetical protein